MRHHHTVFGYKQQHPAVWWFKAHTHKHTHTHTHTHTHVFTENSGEYTDKAIPICTPTPHHELRLEYLAIPFSLRPYKWIHMTCSGRKIKRCCCYFTHYWCYPQALRWFTTIKPSRLFITVTHPWGRQCGLFSFSFFFLFYIFVLFVRSSKK